MQNPTTNQPGFVYVIHATGTNRIKVGYSTSPKDRLAQLQTGSPFPLQLLAAWPGSVEREQRVHRYLKQFRQVGEWFEAPPFIGLQIYELVTKGEITGKVELRNTKKKNVSARKKDMKRRYPKAPKGYFVQRSGTGIAIQQRIRNESEGGKRYCVKYKGYLNGEKMDSILALPVAQQPLALLEIINDYQPRKQAA